MKHLIIVGAQRSGSSYLYHLLDEHPQVMMAKPIRPEPKFFLNSELVEKGESFYKSKFFPNPLSEIKYLGEKSTSYFEVPQVPSRIHDMFPDAKILIILRDPVNRAYSNYKFSFENQMENLSFEKAITLEPERIKQQNFKSSVHPNAYVERGYYIKSIQSYLEVFDQCQINILIFEEIINNLDNVQKLYSWLSVDEKFTPGTLQKIVNQSPCNNFDENLSESFKLLAISYGDSIGQLEDLLGRKIAPWREHHTNLLQK